MNKRTLKKGFTLTELLIVILIIGLLMAFILPQLLRGPAQARDLQRVTDIGRIAAALESYRSSNGSLPDGGCIKPETATANRLIELGIFSVQNFPSDPVKTNDVGSCEGGYLYTLVQANGIPKNGFVIAAKMENAGNANYSSNGNTISDLTTNPPKLEKGVASNKYYIKVSD
ncbi:MAG: prepilin-type N-terminal cleavage/methylation domain-containing protein [Candidatus Gracilibacteria bacterium]